MVAAQTGPSAGPQAGPQLEAAIGPGSRTAASAHRPSPLATSIRRWANIFSLREATAAGDNRLLLSHQSDCESGKQRFAASHDELIDTLRHLPWATFGSRPVSGGERLTNEAFLGDAMSHDETRSQSSDPGVVGFSNSSSTHNPYPASCEP
jgi:hypothetical protein